MEGQDETFSVFIPLALLSPEKRNRVVAADRALQAKEQANPGMPYALCPIPYALCHLPYALCPMRFALRPMPDALCPTRTMYLVPRYLPLDLTKP